MYASTYECIYVCMCVCMYAHTGLYHHRVYYFLRETMLCRCIRDMNIVFYN